MEEKAVTSGQQTQEIEEEKNDKKLSYEELVNVANQLNQQCNALARQNDELRQRLIQVDGLETRLHYLFKVLENRNAFQDPDYIISVCDEIKSILTIKENSEEETKEEK